MTAALEEGEWSAACVSHTLPPGKELVPILQEAGWAPEPVCTGGKSLPHRDSILDRPARSQSLYRLSYRAHISNIIRMNKSKSMQFSEHAALVGELRNFYKVSVGKSGEEK